MTRNEEILRIAIGAKQSVSAVYDGYPRFLCPHMLGQKAGKLNVLCYQFAGKGSKGEVTTPATPSDGPSELWRCMEVEKLKGLEILLEGPWYTCKKHTMSSSCADKILAEVVWE